MSSKKKWTVENYRNENKTESLNSGAGPMDIDHISRESKGKGKDKDTGRGENRCKKRSPIQRPKRKASNGKGI